MTKATRVTRGPCGRRRPFPACLAADGGARPWPSTLRPPCAWCACAPPLFLAYARLMPCASLPPLAAVAMCNFANPGCLLAAQSLWATEWRSQVMTGWVWRAVNGAAFMVDVRPNWRPSVPPVLPFLVVCLGVVCRWGCLWGCSNPLTLSVCRVI